MRKVLLTLVSAVLVGLASNAAHASEYTCKLTAKTPGYHQALPIVDHLRVETDEVVINIWFPDQNAPVTMPLYKGLGPVKSFAAGYWSHQFAKPQLMFIGSQASGIITYTCEQD
jgi:hypothetical protein